MPGSSSTTRMRSPGSAEVCGVMSAAACMPAKLWPAYGAWMSRMQQACNRSDWRNSRCLSYACDRRSRAVRFRSAPGVRQHGVRHKRIGPPLPPEGRNLLVAGDEGHVVAERPELAGDRVDQVLVAAAWEVGAADRAGEEYVADLGEPGLAVEEHHVAGRVAGAVVDLPFRLAEGDGIAIVQPAIGCERTGLR